MVVCLHMAVHLDTLVATAARQFSDGSLLGVERFGKGNINDTFLARFGAGGRETHIILQRINGRVFTSAHRIAANMMAIAPHLDSAAARGEESFAYPRLIPDRGGNVLWVDPEGASWRAAAFVNWATTFPAVKDAAHAGEVGRVLGRFHALTAGVDPAALHETLPGFHNCPLYVAAYERTVEEGRDIAAVRLGSAGVADMVRFVSERRARAGTLEAAIAAGHCMRRVMHGDPKCDNVLIDMRSGRGVGLVDFDTVQPGLWLYDFGDAARSIANPAGEDAPPDSVSFDMSLFTAFAEAYLAETSDRMTDRERELLPTAVWVLTFELGVRFLGDYLIGDVYFRVSDSDLNRRRALVQFRLCADIEARLSGIEQAPTGGATPR